MVGESHDHRERMSTRQPKIQNATLFPFILRVVLFLSIISLSYVRRRNILISHNVMLSHPSSMHIRFGHLLRLGHLTPHLRHRHHRRHCHRCGKGHPPSLYIEQKCLHGQDNRKMIPRNGTMSGKWLLSWRSGWLSGDVCSSDPLKASSSNYHGQRESRVDMMRRLLSSPIRAFRNHPGFAETLRRSNHVQ